MAWISINALVSVNKVTLQWAWLVLRLVPQMRTFGIAEAGFFRLNVLPVATKWT